MLVLTLLFTAGVRYRLLDVPLERDEGEYAYAGQLILQGIPPYGEIYNMKLPGIYAAYAVILKIFGQNRKGHPRRAYGCECADRNSRLPSWKVYLETRQRLVRLRLVRASLSRGIGAGGLRPGRTFRVAAFRCRNTRDLACAKG